MENIYINKSIDNSIVITSKKYLILSDCYHNATLQLYS